MSLRGLFLLFWCLAIPGNALIGFELEISPFVISKRHQPGGIIPERTVLFTSSSELWSITCDVFKEYGIIKNDLEIVTKPFPETFLGISELQQALGEINIFFMELNNEMERQKLNSTEKVEININEYIDESDYIVEWDKSKGEEFSVSPQTTFPILPTHYHSFLCDFLGSNLKLPKAMSTFIKPSSRFGISVMCQQFFDTLNEPFAKELKEMKNEQVLSFLTLLYQYMIWSTSGEQVDYPKLIAGPLILRGKFSDVFGTLPQEAKEFLLKDEIIYKFIASARGEDIASIRTSFVYPNGYYTIVNGVQGPKQQGPTIEQWVEAFTSKNNPTDLFSEITESMGRFPLEDVRVLKSSVHSKVLSHFGWVLEARCMSTISPFETTSSLLKVYEMINFLNKIPESKFKEFRDSIANT